MPTFQGTNGHDTVTPELVSPGVLAFGEPAPSEARDFVFGGSGNDTIATAGGADVVGGGRGDDEIDLGAGDDVAAWTSPDGDDTITGGEGQDLLVIAGDARAESYSIYDGFAGASFFRDVGLVTLTTEGVESFELDLSGPGGRDYVQVSDLSFTDLETLLLTFGGHPRDSLSFIGTGSGETLTFADTTDGFTVEGLGVTTTVGGFHERAELIVALGEGGDVVEAAGFTGARLIVAAGTGDDTGMLGAGDDRWVAVGTPGNDTVDAGDGRDTLDLDASLANDVITLAGTGTEATASIAGSTLLLRNFERMEIESAGGNDVIDASGMTADLRLTAFGGAGGDTITGGALGDVLDGGAGNDDLTGGGGRDRFVFGAENTNGVAELDIITDYAAGDRLDLGVAAEEFTAAATEDGLLISYLVGDMDQVLLRGVTSLAEVDIVI